MANTGYTINQGIQQVFTSGPAGIINSLVTSSYSNGSITFGPIVNYKESFVSGSVELLLPCATVFNRYYQDPFNCPVGGCPQPVLNSVVVNCNPYNYTYSVSYNFISSSGFVPTTKIEFSTNSSFSTNTGSVTYDNTQSTQLPIDVSGLSSLPLSTTPVYFRAKNNCIGPTTSSYSNVISAACVAALPCCIPSFNSITENLGVVSINWTLNGGNCAAVSSINVQSSTDGINWTSNTGSPNSPRSFTSPTTTTYYRIIAECSSGSSTATDPKTYTPPITCSTYRSAPYDSNIRVTYRDCAGVQKTTTRTCFSTICRLEICASSIVSSTETMSKIGPCTP
tara:strand:- start:1180 stop:2193 length:1014 start_codon:yes stop_codon:yes gene_type:complete